MNDHLTATQREHFGLTEPTTEEGRALLDDLTRVAAWPSANVRMPTATPADRELADRILAIEAEARATADAEREQHEMQFDVFTRDIADRDAEIRRLREALEKAGWWIVTNAGPQDWWPASWKV